MQGQILCVALRLVKSAVLYLESKEHLGRIQDRIHTVTQKHPLGVGGQSLGWFFSQNSWAALCLDSTLISGDKARVLTLAPRCHVTNPTPSKPPCVSPYSHPSPIPIYPQPTCPSAALCTLSSPASTKPPSYLRNLHQCLSHSVFSALGPRAQGHGCLHSLSLSGSSLDCQLHW